MQAYANKRLRLSCKGDTSRQGFHVLKYNFRRQRLENVRGAGDCWGLLRNPKSRAGLKGPICHMLGSLPLQGERSLARRTGDASLLQLGYFASLGTDVFCLSHSRLRISELALSTCR